MAKKWLVPELVLKLKDSIVVNILSSRSRSTWKRSSGNSTITVTKSESFLY